MSTEDSAAIAARRRRNNANTNALSDYEADLTNQDRAKQRLAVRRYLSLKVKNNWSFPWPKPPSPPTPNPSSLGTTAPLDGKTFEDSQIEWKERDEWLSETTVSGNDTSEEQASESSPKSPSSRKTSILYRRKRRLKEELAKEMTWNDGLCCFTARRDAWTGARITSKLEPTIISTSCSDIILSDSEANEKNNEDTEENLVEELIEIPIAPPLIPAENYLRSCITPRMYNTVYDKVIMNSITPTCPINLMHITRSCVQGWKRDGQWPPASSGLIESPLQERQSIASLLMQDEPGNPRQQDERGKKGIPENQTSKDGRDENMGEHDEDSTTKKKGLGSCLGRILGRGS
ncbi:hypothetical protein K3495_g10372 [Podosphaera aphanis]|nr:hypothetical protein K3495_g10372 [Podosphaera aphanis]